MKLGAHHTEEAKAKNRLAHLGKKLTDEHKQKVSVASKRSGANAEVSRKRSESLLAFYASSEGQVMKEQLSEQRKGNSHALGYRHTEWAKINMSKHRMGQQHMLGHKQTEEAKQKVSLATRGESNPMYGKKHLPEICQMLSEICKERWENWTFEERRTRLIQLSKHATPTTPELKVLEMLSELYPNEWKWVGNKVTVGELKPDFKHISRKLLILEHGIYWHLWKPQKEHPELELTKEKVEIVDILPYIELGYRVLIVWEDEIMKHPDQVKAKIAEFVGVGK